MHACTMGSSFLLFRHARQVVPNVIINGELGIEIRSLVSANWKKAK